MRTVRIVIVSLALLVSALALPAIAAAHPDYRPWKAALQRAFERWDAWYFCSVEASDIPAGQMFMGPTMPLGFNLRTNEWGWNAQVAATIVTALYGQVPNGEWGPAMRSFLRPFLDRHVQPWQAPTPWLAEALAASRQGRAPTWATP